MRQGRGHLGQRDFKHLQTLPGNKTHYLDFDLDVDGRQDLKPIKFDR